MYDTLLLPTDGSTGTSEALEHAATIAGDQDATVHVLYVLDKRFYMTGEADTKGEIRRSLQEESDRALEAAQLRLEEEAVDCTTVHREGVPHRTIIDYATEEEMDLIVMGTHGKTGKERLESLGSTTERVVKNGSTPVLVVEIG